MTLWWWTLLLMLLLLLAKHFKNISELGGHNDRVDKEDAEGYNKGAHGRRLTAGELGLLLLV